ncbi:hypothetical protein JVU11DRAFT_3361 [Chiua virens]|nr:hypothetical protein JVU11DRAFT_3361 [Chiua virens]
MNRADPRGGYTGQQEPSHSEESRGSTDDGRHSAYEIPLLTRAFEWPSPEGDEPPAPRSQGRFSAEPAPPLAPTVDPPHGQGPATSHYESRLLRPPLYADSQYGRHHSAPLYGSDDLDRRMSFGRLPYPGTQGEASSSRVVLPPVSHLLGELGMLDDYEGGPVLPQLRLPEEAGMGAAPRMGEEEGERREERERGEKRGRVEMGGEEKRPGIRKIYVACDFCRGEWHAYKCREARA